MLARFVSSPFNTGKLVKKVLDIYIGDLYGSDSERPGSGVWTLWLVEGGKGDNGRMLLVTSRSQKTLYPTKGSLYTGNQSDIFHCLICREVPYFTVTVHR